MFFCGQISIPSWSYEAPTSYRWSYEVPITYKWPHKSLTRGVITFSHQGSVERSGSSRRHQRWRQGGESPQNRGDSGQTWWVFRECCMFFFWYPEKSFQSSMYLGMTFRFVYVWRCIWQTPHLRINFKDTTIGNAAIFKYKVEPE